MGLSGAHALNINATLMTLNGHQDKESHMGLFKDFEQIILTYYYQ